MYWCDEIQVEAMPKSGFKNRDGTLKKWVVIACLAIAPIAYGAVHIGADQLTKANRPQYGGFTQEQAVYACRMAKLPDTCLERHN